MANKALITGITGQDGSYLAELLLKNGYEVAGMVRRTSGRAEERIGHLAGKVALFSGDLLDFGSIVRILQEFKPTEVYNLAAQSFVSTSFDQPTFTAQVTGLGVAHMLEAVRIVDPGIRFYQASSSEMFGKVVETPQTETTPFHPRSPYGVAKLYGHWLTVNYREAYGMKCCSGILFNHESPRRGSEFVTRKVTLAAARIRLGLQDRLEIGNLDARRDWGFAGDYVRAMWAMMQNDASRDYVIATGVTHSIRDLVEMAFEVVGIDWRDVVFQSRRLFRPAEVDLLLGDATRAKNELRWEPKVGFRDLVRLMVEHDLEHEAPRPAVVALGAR